MTAFIDFPQKEHVSLMLSTWMGKEGPQSAT
jgi:hypothetical protein